MPHSFDATVLGFPLSWWLLVGLAIVVALIAIAARTRSPGPHDGLVALAFVVVVAAGGWWLLVYDTAAGRCNRGDLGACIVYEAQQKAR